MEDFLIFMQSVKSFLENKSAERKVVHIVLGNESCDLDSTTSSLVLAYFLWKRNSKIIVIPVLNVSRKLFSLRTENCFVLDQAGIALENLVFRDEINFQIVISEHTVTASLVDHHILSRNDEVLSNIVTEIFDHRPMDISYKWNTDKVKVRIEEVASCCTLIADEILRRDCSVLTKPLAYLLYQTIIYDSIALKPAHGKAKILDIEVAELLKSKFKIDSDPQQLFDVLWSAHNDVTHLTPLQLLFKDLKVVDNVFIPGLPMLVEEFLTKTGAYQAIEEFAIIQNVTCLLLVGLDASKSVRRDIGIYSVSAHDEIKEALIDIFNCVESDLQLEERNNPLNKNVQIFRINNIKASRKQLIPLVKLALQRVNTN